MYKNISKAIHQTVNNLKKREIRRKGVEENSLFYSFILFEFLKNVLTYYLYV